MFAKQDISIAPGIRLTRIIATIGPASNKIEVIHEMIRAGMDIARLNLSHGSHDDHRKTVEIIRKAAANSQRPVAILTDIPGPKLRVHSLPTCNFFLKQGEEIILSADPGPDEIGIGPASFIPLSETGDIILIADGALTCMVIEGGTCQIRAEVRAGGSIRMGAGVVIPGRRPEVPYASEELKKNLRFALDIRTDIIALSFVGGADHIHAVREILAEEGSAIPLIAKIETAQAVEKFDEILKASDGIMVARGDLGVELPISCVPHVQKEIITKSNIAGKPVITATEMLESMVEHSRPTRAEVTDVANAIVDGTDATMLSAETSLGKYPVQSVTMMAQIACDTELYLPYQKILLEHGAWHQNRPSEVISFSACYLANTLSSRAIVAYTKSGVTAERVSRCRPKAPILAITSDEQVARRLLLRWGVIPSIHPPISSADELFAASLALASDMGLTSSKDSLVIISGDVIGGTKTTNMIKVLPVP